MFVPDPSPRTPHRQRPRMILVWLLWLLDAHGAPLARPSASAAFPGAGRRHGAPQLAVSRRRLGPGPDPGVIALGLERRGWPAWPSAACQNAPSGFGGIVCCYLCFRVSKKVLKLN
jgi:hypothetical protein